MKRFGEGVLFQAVSGIKLLESPGTVQGHDKGTEKQEAGKSADKIAEFIEKKVEE